MRLREHPGVKGKIDSYPFDPRLLKVKEGFNVRDLDSPDERPALDELKASIKEHGVEEPLRVQLVGEDVFIVRGHRRHKAVMELIEEGEPIEAVLVIQVPKGVNDAALNIDIVVSNADRKDLSQLQIAEVIARQYTVYNWSVPKIAKAISKTEGTVNNYLEIAGLGEAVKEQVRDNVVSATLAKNIAKGVDPEFAAELIRKNAEENARIIGKRRVTAKTIKRDAPKPAPKPAAAQPEPPRGEDKSPEAEAQPRCIECDRPASECRCPSPGQMAVEPQAESLEPTAGEFTAAAGGLCFAHPSVDLILPPEQPEPGGDHAALAELNRPLHHTELVRIKAQAELRMAAQPIIDELTQWEVNENTSDTINVPIELPAAMWKRFQAAFAQASS